jgi:addiction module RelE/StbE family toxin
MTALISPQLLKDLKNITVRIRNNFFEKIRIFEKNHQNLVLNNHPLKHEYKGYRSINITNDYRALYMEITEGNEAIAYFSLLGTHKELYG